MLRHPRNATAGVRCRADEVVDVPKVRVFVRGVNGHRTRLRVESYFAATTHGAPRVAEVASAVAVRYVEGHKLVARARLEHGQVPSQRCPGEQSLCAELECDGALRLEVRIDPRRAVGLVAKLGRRGCLEARRDVAVHRGQRLQAPHDTGRRAHRAQRPLAGVIRIGGRNEPVAKPKLHGVAPHSRRRQQTGSH